MPHRHPRPQITHPVSVPGGDPADPLPRDGTQKALLGPRAAALALALLAVAQFMLILDLTVINVSLPQIGAELGVSGTTASLAIAAYAVPFAGLLLLGGRLADLLGSRRMVLVGLVLFTLASLAAGLAENVQLLIAARAAQGVGAALLSPAALSTVLHLFQGSVRHRALAVWGSVGASGAAIGVVAGGLLVGGPGWRWVFFINVPIGVLVAAVLVRVVPALPGVRTGRVDALGAALATTGMAALVVSLNGSAPAWLRWTAAGVAAAALLAFAVVQRRTAQPLVAPEVFTRRPVQAGVLLMLVATGLLVGAFFLTSFLLQGSLGWSATSAGLAFVPVSLGTIVGAHLAGRLLTEHGAKAVAPASLGVSAVGFTVAAVLVDGAQTGSPAPLIAAMSVVAAGAGGSLVAATTTALSSARAEESGALSAVVNTFHELGAAVGATVFSTVAAVSLVVGGPMDGFTRGFGVAAALAATTALVARRLVPAGRPPAGTATFVH